MMEKKNEYATLDTIVPEANLHISGTIPRKNGLEFWMSIPRPKGVSVDEWEEIQEAKWQRIFGKKEDDENS